MKIEDSEKAKWVVIVDDEFEPTVRYFINEEMAKVVFLQYKNLHNEVIMAKIVEEV